MVVECVEPRLFSKATALHLTTAQARRIALAAQGFLDPAHQEPTLRTLQRTIDRTGVLQVDSVNVLQRAHFMPLYSRMGPYDVDLLRRASEQRPRRLVESWAHVQAFMLVDLWPVMTHRRESYRTNAHKWWGTEVTEELAAGLVEQIGALGASTARELAGWESEHERSKEHWGWNWSITRRTLDYLFMVGDVAVSGRNRQFEIRYDLPERVIPAVHLQAAVPDEREADRELIRRAARSHGLGTTRCLADYYRMSNTAAQRAIDDLVVAGELAPVRVEGFTRPAYLHREARRPRAVRARTLLSPFDPVVWERERTERLFDFHYRIEIYTPATQRVYGYYVLPFLLGEELVGRVDLKADRGTGRLLVKGAHSEDGAPGHTASELAAELERLAGWLGLTGIEVEPRGDLAEELSGLV